MDGLALLTRAAEAGLVVERRGDLLVLRGDPGLDTLAQEILSHKAEVLAALGRAETGQQAAGAGTECSATQGRERPHCGLRRFQDWRPDWLVRLCENADHQHEPEPRIILFGPDEVQVARDWAEAAGVDLIPPRIRNAWFEAKRTVGGRLVTHCDWLNT